MLAALALVVFGAIECPPFLRQNVRYFLSLRSFIARTRRASQTITMGRCEGADGRVQPELYGKLSSPGFRLENPGFPRLPRRAAAPGDLRPTSSITVSITAYPIIR